MPSKTFVLGAGFSTDAGFPLVRTLLRDVLSWIEAEQHPSAKPHLMPKVHGYPGGQFYAGLNSIDPSGSMGFEELMIALRGRLSATSDHDPCYTCQRILRDACGRLLWHKQQKVGELPIRYRNFASWLHEHQGYGQPNAVVSFNWDVLPEAVLAGAKVPWLYTAKSPFVPVLKPHGSINWSDHLDRGWVAESAEWQRVAPGSPYCWLPGRPFTDPFAPGMNQHLRKLILPGDPEEEAGVNLIWAEAEEAIRERDIVVFIGYSLPNYDSFSTRFFRRVVAGKKIEAYVRSSETLQHYRRVFGEISTYDPLAFAECPYARIPFDPETTQPRLAEAIGVARSPGQ